MARKGTMYDRTIQSEFLQEEMTLKIYEPEQINSLYETNVCIMQDGNDYYQMGRVATLSDRLHEDDSIINTIFVGIHYIDRADRLKKYHPDGEQYEAYQQFLLEEVVPLLKEIVPLNPLGITFSLMGDSLAGTLALLTTLANSDIFKKAIIQSPLVDETVLNIVKESKHVSNIELYHSIGLKETSVKTTQEDEVDFVTPNKMLAKQLRDMLVHYHYEEIADGNHTWKYWQIELPDVLVQMFG